MSSYAPQAIEELIRLGRLKEAATLLKRVDARDVPRMEKVKFANLCRRTGLIALALKALRPRIFDPKSGAKLADATGEERAEYAMLLMRLGAVREAARDLTEITDYKPAPLYRAFARITTWDYRLARTDLRAYLAQELDVYQRRIGEMNLAAAAYYAGDLEEAHFAVRSVLRTAEGRLRANALEMHARILHETGDVPQAEKALTEAETLLAGSSSYDQLFLVGLRSYFTAMRTGETGAIASFREEARARGRFESVREADAFELRVRPDPELFANLYFGTPYVAFRRLVAQQTGLQPADRVHVWGTGEKILDLDPLVGLPSALEGKLGLLLRVLASDRYRPFAAGTLFQELYPNEYFDFQTSPARVKQLVYRVRVELARDFPELQIVNRASLFTLEISPGGRLRTALEADISTANGDFLFQLRHHFGDTEFGARDLESKLGLSSAQLRRRLTEALASGELERFGAGPATRYALSLTARVVPTRFKSAA